MKKAILLLSIITFASCIPTRIAPTIKDYKVTTGKKFKRSLTKQQIFVFEDPKDTNEFYNYINTKYELEHTDVEYNVPITVNKEAFYLSFQEVEIPTKTINLVPILIDASLESKGHDPLLKDAEFSRQGNWYLALTVTDKDINDCLKEDYKHREDILKFLRELKTEYLNTHNYIEALLRNKLV